MPNLLFRLAAASKAFREAAPGTGSTDADPDLFRRITGSRRDLNPIEQEKAQSIAYYLWRQNPMARRITEMLVDFVVGDGVTVTAPDDAVQEVAIEWWTDPVMRLELRHPDFVRDLSLFGELALPVFTAGMGGRTRVGYLDQARIGKVEKDPENALIDRLIYVRPTGGAGLEEARTIINLDESDPASPTLVGDVHYFAVNRTITATRGTPDLLSLADWIDGYDQILFNMLERSGLLNAFIWDVELAGADPTKVQEWLKANGTAPRPGTVRVHNEREKWSAVAPQMGSYEAQVTANQIKNMALGGAGLPEAWFADGDAANRATLAAQGDPTYKMLTARQRYVRSMFEDMLKKVVQEAIKGGRLPVSVNPLVTVNMPDPSSDDTKAIAQALPQLATAMLSAIEDELISKKSARRVFLMLVGQMGVDLDPEDEEEAIAEEKSEADAAKGDAMAGSPAMAALMDRLNNPGQPAVPTPATPMGKTPGQMGPVANAVPEPATPADGL